MAAAGSSGFLLIDKPAGATSQDVVTRVRRALGASRAGHTGTLDPFATGLLIVLVGSATRLARFVPSQPKTYEAEIVFGVETDTHDATGTPAASAPPPDAKRVEAALGALTGSILQVPPAYSAKQIDGKRAYVLARRGEAVQLPPVGIQVYSWELLARDEERWRFRITCGSGTYVRALARDLGRQAGSVAHLGALRRTAIGPFVVSDALAPGDVVDGAGVHPPQDALTGMPRVGLSQADVRAVREGRALPAHVDGTVAALLDEHDRLVAVAERQAASWQPRVVLSDA